MSPRPTAYALAATVALLPALAPAPAASAAASPAPATVRVAWGPLGDRYEISQVRVVPRTYTVTATLRTAPRRGPAAMLWPRGVPASVTCAVAGGGTKRTDAVRASDGSLVASLRWRARAGQPLTCTFRKSDSRTPRVVRVTAGR